jgi:hypothetical protein
MSPAARRSLTSENPKCQPTSPSFFTLATAPNPWPIWPNYRWLIQASLDTAGGGPDCVPGWRGRLTGSDEISEDTYFLDKPGSI